MPNNITVQGNYAYVQLTQGKVTVIDKADVAKIRPFTWHSTWNPDIQGFYAAGRTVNADGNPTTIYLHRLITGATGSLKVDHKDGDTLNNRQSNLRVVTNAENMRNRRDANTNSKTGIRGVSVHKCKPSGLMYVARFHKPVGKGYDCKYFPFSPEGLIRATEQVQKFITDADPHSPLPTTPSPVEAETIHSRLCDAYAENLITLTREGRSSVTVRT